MTNYTTITNIVTLLNETEMMIPGLLVDPTTSIDSDFLNTLDSVTLLVPRRFQSMMLTGWMERQGYMLNDISSYTFNVDGTKISFETLEHFDPNFDTNELNHEIFFMENAVFYPFSNSTTEVPNAHQ